MNFSYAKHTLLRPRKEKWLSTFLIALLCATAFFLPYIIMGKGYFIFYGDFNAQQIPFYKMCHEAVRSGNFGWNWYTDLGANFIGSYSFYLLGSPFFWLTIPFPNSFIPYLMGPLLILKFACAALTAYIYIRRFTKTPDAARLGALLYAFSGFSVYNIFFNHFHEAIICLPLLLWALEVLITENRRGIFALMVTLCALINYFFFFGMVVFCIIYFFVRVLSKAVNVKITRFLVLLLEAVLGVLMASILLLPSFYTVIQNERVSEVLMGWSALTYSNEQLYLNIIQCFFFPPDLPAIASFFPGTDREWASLAGWLPVFSMVGVFAFFKNREKSWLKKIIGICVLFAFIPILNSLFSALNSNYYARWFYMPILMMCLATAITAEDNSVSFKGAFKWVSGITLAFILAIGFIPQKSDGEIIYGLFTQNEDSSYKLSFWLFSAIAVLGLVILFILLKIRRKNETHFFKASVACVCIVAVIYGNCYMGIGRLYSYDVEETMIDRLIEGEVDFSDDSNFRIDTYGCVDNTGMYLSVPSMNTFHSVVPGSIVEYYDYLGEERDVGSRLDTSLPAIRSLLSVKYILNPTNSESFLNTNNEPLMTGYKYKKTDGGYYIYENENYIPFGFSYQYYMTEDFCSVYSNSGRSRLMLKAVLLNDEQIKKYRDCLTDISELTDTDDILERIEYQQSVANGIVPGEEDSEDNEDVEDTENVVETEDVTDTEKVIENTNATTLMLSDEEMAKDCDNLAATAAYDFSIDNGGFTAKVSRDNRSLVFFSVPFEEGWSCTVNGKKTDIEKVNVGFMAVAVPAGDSVIRFDYTTPGLSLGIKITVGAAAVFIIYFLASLFFIKRYECETVYPEGDELIAKWQREDNYDPADDGYDISSHSLLDEIEDIHHVSPPDDGGFEGGFTINTDLFTNDDA